MKKFLYMAVAAIAALSSCTSDDIVVNENENQNQNAKAPVFTATIEGECATRTQLIEGSTAGELTKVNWVNTDKVNVQGSVYNVTPGTTDATTATLTKKSGKTPEKVDGKYYAVYPSSIAFNTSTQTLTLPATQTYDATTNGIGNVPMVAVSEDTELQFKNICTVLAIKVTEGTVKAIKVMADKKNLSGDFTLDPSTYSITATSGENYVVLDCGEGVTADNTTFYIAIPPQEYSSLQIYLSADGTNYKEAMATKVAAGLGTLERNKIFPITYAKNAVQLWADGPYFATTNVGGDQQKYQWGATAAGGTGNYTTVTGGGITAGTYDLDHDTAYKIWGSAWRMPTQAECAALLDNSNYNFDNSAFILSSKTSGYGSISFPVEDRGNSYDANYCTSSVHNNGWPYLLNFMVASSGSQFANASGTSSPADVRYVRAVLATPAAAPAVTPTPAADPNLLAGEFSVGDNKKVKFTKGNLWCNTTTSPVTWAFEANQYDYPVGNDYTSDGTTDGTWLGTHVGHFFWTKTAAASYAHSYNDGDNTTSDNYWLKGDVAERTIAVAGTSDLYVLSSEEWKYLFQSRDNASSLYKVNVTVAEQPKCLIIAPDGYKGTIADSYDATAWATAEADGLVCLPAAGYRGLLNIVITYNGECGYYESSTPYSHTAYAYHLTFKKNSSGSVVVVPADYDSRGAGLAIRLVQKVQAGEGGNED